MLLNHMRSIKSGNARMRNGRATVGLACALTTSVLVILFFCLPAATNAQDANDKITFDNGDISSGTVQEMDDSDVIFLGQLTGKVAYSWKDIKSLDLFSSTGVQAFTSRHFGPVVTGKVFQHGGTRTINTASYVESSASDVVEHWSGTLSSQDTVTQATQDTYQLGGTFHLAYDTTSQDAWKHQIIQFDSKATFGEASKANASPVRTALFEGTLAYNLYISSSPLAQNFPNAYNSYAITGIADGYHNLSLGIQAQQTYGGGFAWNRTLKGKPDQNGIQLEQTFALQGDLRYSQLELYSPGINANLVGTGLRESYSVSAPLPFGTKQLTFYETILAIPYFNDPHSLQIRGSTNLMVALTKNQRLQLGPQLYDDFFRNAPKGTKENYLQPALTLSYCFNPVAACK